MSEYLTKWGKKYRCRAIYDLNTGEYIRNHDGTLDGTDIYIECEHGCQIYDIDSRKSIIEAYIPTIKRGRIIVSKIYKLLYDDFDSFVKNKSDNENEENNDEDMLYNDEGDTEDKNKKGKVIDWDRLYAHINKLNNSMLFYVQEYDDEVTFRFNGNKHMDEVAKIMKAKKPMASTTPFNVKFLPSHKEKLARKKVENEKYVKYDMPSGYWTIFQTEIMPAMCKKYQCKLDKGLQKCYKLFSKHKKQDFVKLAEENNYKINHYIHSLGLWDEFVEFLKEHVKE